MTSKIAPGSTLPFEPSKYYALVIGVEQYEDEQIRRLSGVISDITRVGRFFGAGWWGGPYQMSLRLFNKHASARRIFAEIANLEKLPSDAAVLIYFSGHGESITHDDEIGGQASSGSYFLVPYDAKVDNARSFLPETLISSNQLVETLSRLQVKNLLLVLDCCYAGGLAQALKRSFLNRNEEARSGWHFLSAARANQQANGRSRDIAEDGGNSLFTKYLLRGLFGKAGDGPKGVIDVIDLFNFVRLELIREAERIRYKWPSRLINKEHSFQEPQLESLGDHHFPIAFFEKGFWGWYKRYKSLLRFFLFILVIAIMLWGYLSTKFYSQPRRVHRFEYTPVHPRVAQALATLYRQKDLKRSPLNLITIKDISIGVDTSMNSCQIIKSELLKIDYEWNKCETVPYSKKTMLARTYSGSMYFEFTVIDIDRFPSEVLQTKLSLYDYTAEPITPFATRIFGALDIRNMFGASTRPSIWILRFFGYADIEDMVNQQTSSIEQNIRECIAGDCPDKNIVNCPD